jgi:hypothetical protein
VELVRGVGAREEQPVRGHGVGRTGERPVDQADAAVAAAHPAADPAPAALDHHERRVLLIGHQHL